MRIINSTEKKATKDENEDLLESIKRNFKIAEEVYSEQREQAREDFQFRAGDQWDDRIKQDRSRQGRPCLTINKIPQFIKQVVNNQKINRPSININPGDSSAKIENAKVLQAIIKNVEGRSMAENAYDTAFDSAVTCGEGYFRIVTEYADEMSFDQDISMRSIDNTFSVYIDPDFKSDFTGIKWAFVFDDMPKEEFERQYPDSKCANGEFFVTGADSWIRPDLVRIAEYFYIEKQDVEIVLLSSGDTVRKSQYNKMAERFKKENKIVKERTTQLPTVKWVKTNGHEILESTEFPSDYIPIIPVFADTYIKDGKRIFEGIVRQSKDAQRAYNFWYSAETEMIALAPKATYIGVVGQFKGVEQQWANANSSNLPYLEYNPVSSGGQPAPPPTRTQFDPQIQSISIAKQGANEDLKATTGIYDPSLGKEQKEASGRALITKQRQGEVTNFMYIDNLCKSLKYAAKVLLSMIPRVYDTERVIRIRGGVNQEDEIKVVNSFDEDEPILLEVGKYDVDVSIGPYGENQRQDAIDTMLSLMQISPELVNIMGDLFIEKQDWNGAKEIAERMKIMLPPALQKDNKEVPPEIQAQMAQIEQAMAEKDMQLANMQQIIANVTAEANRANAEAANKQADLESKERIAAADNRTKLLIEQMKQQSSDTRLAFQEEMAYLNAKAKGAPEVPAQGDEVVLSGVNDPVTEATQAEEAGLSPEEEAALMAKLQNFTPETTRM